MSTSDSGPKYFLNVSRSVSGKVWNDRLDVAGQRLAGAIAQQQGLSDILARILAGRGVMPEAVEAFLNPTLRGLMPDPSSLSGMDDLAKRLADAIQTGEKIALFGDYDVDGASSCALMTRYLNSFGIEPDCHIPDRIFEGYGPNSAALDKLIDAGASLIITLDCGTVSHAPIAHVVERGADVLVLDHHLSDDKLPPAISVVNPNRADDISGLGYLCAAGVTFMALVATNRVLRERGESTQPDLMAMIDLVALATICDVVPLTGLNRAFVVRGVELMRQGHNKGLAALALAARINGPINPYHLGFLLGPRINAGGRIGDAGMGTKLLSTNAEDEALVLAARLDELNSERQKIEKAAVDEAVEVATIEVGEGEGPAVLVLVSEHWHPGVVGLVAARLRERFSRPAFAIAMKPDGTGSGSGRSMPGVDLGSAVVAAREAGLIQAGGGHAMAAGITLSQAEISGFRSHMNEALEAAVTDARRSSGVSIDAAITARTATAAFVHEVQRAGPFGTGNSNPVFALPGHKVSFADVVGAGGHVRCTLSSADGAKLGGIAFRAAGTPLGQVLLNSDRSRPLHFCGTLALDHWQGRERVQLRLIDAADPAENGA